MIDGLENTHTGQNYNKEKGNDYRRGDPYDYDQASFGNSMRIQYKVCSSTSDFEQVDIHIQKNKGRQLSHTID